MLIIIMKINKFVFIPYIKIEYLIKFNKRISKSKTISTLLNYIYPGYEEIKLFESEFIENLFNDVIILFFSFFISKWFKNFKNKQSNIIFYSK